MPTIWIGLAALLKAILPVILRYTAADSGITASSSSLYSSAFAVWWIGNIIIWGLLTVLWPITYFSITVITDFYLMVTWYGGFFGGIGLAALSAILLLISATQDSAAWTYWIIQIILDPATVFLTWFLYEDAVLYYRPKVYTIRKEIGN